MFFLISNVNNTVWTNGRSHIHHLRLRFPPILFFRRVNADKDTLSDVRVHLKVHLDFLICTYSTKRFSLYTSIHSVLTDIECRSVWHIYKVKSMGKHNYWHRIQRWDIICESQRVRIITMHLLSNILQYQLK